MAPIRRGPVAAIAAIALAIGLPSLSYPFGRDQGLYFYVAREWIQRGAIPYRDVLDHKTPGIYLLHALSQILFGQHMWAIRVMDMGGVALLGYVAARLVTPRGERPAPVLVALAWLFGSVLFFGYLNWWDTAQSELWYGTLGLGSVAAIRTAQKERTGQALSGAFAASAMIMKPPAVWFVLLALVLLAHRAWGEREGRIARIVRGKIAFGVGFAVPTVLVFGYFGLHHALPALVDIVVGANGYYVAHETSVSDPIDMVGKILDYVGVYNPLSTLGILALIGGIAWGARTKQPEVRARYVLATAVCSAAFAAVAMQQKFYLLHWDVMVPAATVVFATIAYDALRLSTAKERAAWLVLASFLFAFVLSGRAVQGWFRFVKHAARSADGTISRSQFVLPFAFPEIEFSYADSEATGLWLREHSSPDDLVSVRGFQPEIYAVAERRHGGRFFWTTFITNPARAYRRAEWLAEDRRDLDTRPPRFVVVLANTTEAPDSASYFPGYERRVAFGNLVVLERPAAP
jgi:hypothetical protein